MGHNELRWKGQIDNFSVINGSGIVLATNGWQAINWTNVDQDVQCPVVSLTLNDLMASYQAINWANPELSPTVRLGNVSCSKM